MFLFRILLEKRISAVAGLAIVILIETTPPMQSEAQDRDAPEETTPTTHRY